MVHSVVALLYTSIRVMEPKVCCNMLSYVIQSYRKIVSILKTWCRIYIYNSLAVEDLKIAIWGRKLIFQAVDLFGSLTRVWSSSRHTHLNPIDPVRCSLKRTPSNSRSLHHSYHDYLEFDHPSYRFPSQPCRFRQHHLPDWKETLKRGFRFNVMCVGRGSLTYFAHIVSQTLIAKTEHRWPGFGEPRELWRLPLSYLLCQSSRESYQTLWGFTYRRPTGPTPNTITLARPSVSLSPGIIKQNPKMFFNILLAKEIETDKYSPRENLWRFRMEPRPLDMAPKLDYVLVRDYLNNNR